MINVSFLVPILFEVMSFNDRPCLPNIGAPLKQMAFGVSLESIRRKLVEVSTPGVGWSWGSTLTPNYGGLGGGGGGLELSNSATS